MHKIFISLIFLFALVLIGITWKYTVPPEIKAPDFPFQISDASGAREEIGKENIIITLNSNVATVISGLVLTNNAGVQSIIPGGSKLPIQGNINSREEIVV